MSRVQKGNIERQVPAKILPNPTCGLIMRQALSRTGDGKNEAQATSSGRIEFPIINTTIVVSRDALLQTPYGVAGSRREGNYCTGLALSRSKRRTE